MRAILLETLGRRIDLSVVAEFERREDLTARLEDVHANLVVIGLAPDESDEFGAALLAELTEPPDACILLISSDGACAYLHNRRPSRRVLRDFSPDSLLAAILAPVTGA